MMEMREPQTLDHFIVRTEWKDTQEISSTVPRHMQMSFRLQALDAPDVKSCFEKYVAERSAREASDEVYQLAHETRGQWTATPNYAVYAVWQISNLKNEDAFVESRKKLFDIRKRVLPTFAFDWLLKRLDQRGQYMVVGLYGDEEGATRLCREHPEIKQFIQSHPASELTATDLTGLRCFRVLSFFAEK